MLLFFITPQLALSDLEFTENMKDLQCNNITHILTADIQPLKQDISDNFKTKFLECQDKESEDLLNHFEDCIQFIKNAIESSAENKILIHWYSKDIKDI